MSASEAAPSFQSITLGQPVDSYPIQPVAPQADPLAASVLRGVRSLGPDQKVACTSVFCITHLRRVDRYPTRIMIARDHEERWRTFDDVIMAAEAGNPDAEFMVAEVLTGGHGVPANRRRAAIWYTRAAEHGNTLAVARLNRLRADIVPD